MAKWVKVEYWNGQKRYVEQSKVEAIEAAIVRGKPFRLAHSNGVDFVQPKAIALITEPTWQEYPQLSASNVKSLPEPKNEEGELVPKEISDLLRQSCRALIIEKDKVKAGKLREEYQTKLDDWKKSKGNGKMVS